MSNHLPEFILQLNSASFNYSLPDEKIATEPAAERDGSRLLVYQDGQIRDQAFRHMPALLPAGTLLVMNDTRVMPARLLFQKNNGGEIEIFCLAPMGLELSQGYALKGGIARWQCLVGNARRWPAAEKLSLDPGSGISLWAERGEKLAEGFAIQFTWAPAELSFGEVLAAVGSTPLPPYIKRKARAEDKLRYQTVYAQAAGAVAAPTAGLHFTPELLTELQAKTVNPITLTLHVGAGTFKPLSTASVSHHTMHAEPFEVSRVALQVLFQQLNADKGPVVAVGTTSLRTLESLYWLGAAALTGKLVPGETPELGQWQPYGATQNLPTPIEAIEALLQWVDVNDLPGYQGSTRLMIVPGYDFKLVQGLITNFHQPNSTLLLLIAAFMGEAWHEIYAHALANNYRFLSYGDASLLWRTK